MVAVLSSLPRLSGWWSLAREISGKGSALWARGVAVEDGFDIELLPALAQRSVWMAVVVFLLEEKAFLRYITR
jgi:hypothetical protein